MAFAIIYILIVDLPLGQIPASIAWLSVTHATTTLAGFENRVAVCRWDRDSRALGDSGWRVAFRRISRIET